MLFVSYYFISSPGMHEDFGRIFLESEVPRCEDALLAIELEIKKDLERRIGSDRVSVTILWFKSV